MATRKSSDADCNSVVFLKYVLHIFNIVFLLSGIGVLGVGVWTVAAKHQYVVLLTNATYEVAAWVLIVAGCFVCIVTAVGCIGVLQENRFLILMYTFALLLIFLLEAMVGIMSFLYEPHVADELYLNLNKTFIDNYKVDDSKTRAIDQMQIEYKCCGANLFEDWQYSHWQREKLSEGLKVPNSCCKTLTPQCGKSDHPSNIHYTKIMEAVKVEPDSDDETHQTSPQNEYRMTNEKNNYPVHAELIVVKGEHENVFMNEEKDTSCCEAQDMSLLDDAMSDMKHQNILVPHVILEEPKHMTVVKDEVIMDMQDEVFPDSMG